MEIEANVLVKEIHSAFDKEADMLVAMSEGRGPVLALEEKVQRLKKIGFDGCSEIAQLERLKADEPPYEFARKYRAKYPSLKFITRGQIVGLCRKYNLVVKKLSEYIGAVPEQKMVEIEHGINKIDNVDLPADFTYFLLVEDGEVADELRKIQSDGYIDDGLDNLYKDMPITMLEIMRYNTYRHESRGWKMLSKSEIMEAFRKQGISEEDLQIRNVRVEKSDNSQLIIAAPESMFKKTPEPSLSKDPIVLQPVIGGYLVIAKWSLEANDELLTVPEMN